jgi:hypothetical protein
VNLQGDHNLFPNINSVANANNSLDQSDIMSNHKNNFHPNRSRLMSYDINNQMTPFNNPVIYHGGGTVIQED